MIVELNLAIRHADVAIALVANRVIVPSPGGDRGTGARSSRITKLWDEALAFQLFVLRDTAQLVDCREDIEQADGLAASPTRLGDARRDDDQRHPRRFFPQREFLPVLLLADVHAVVRPQDDDRIGGMRAGVERVEQPSHLGVGKADTCQIAAHGRLPFIVIHHPLMPLAAQPISVRRGNVIQVTSHDRRQEHLVRRIQVEVLLRHKPGNMRAEDADGVEEGFGMRFGQLGARPVDHFVIGHTALVFVDRPPVEEMRWRLTDSFTFGETLPPHIALRRRFGLDRVRPERRRQRFGRFRKIVIPQLRLVLLFAIAFDDPRQAVKDFSAAVGAVTAGAQVLGEGHGRRQGRRAAPILTVVVDTRGRWTDTGHDADPRRITRRRRAMGVGEQHTALC